MCKFGCVASIVDCCRFRRSFSQYDHLMFLTHITFGPNQKHCAATSTRRLYTCMMSVSSLCSCDMAEVYSATSSHASLCTSPASTASCRSVSLFAPKGRPKAPKSKRLRPLKRAKPAEKALHIEPLKPQVLFNLDRLDVFRSRPQRSSFTDWDAEQAANYLLNSSQGERAEYFSKLIFLATPYQLAKFKYHYKRLSNRMIKKIKDRMKPRVPKHFEGTGKHLRAWDRRRCVEAKKLYSAIGTSSHGAVAIDATGVMHG